MSGVRRLAKLEGTLTPKAATVLWLTEAHQFGTLPAYVGWLVDQPTSAAPLYRVPQAAEASVCAAMRGEKPVVRERAVRDAVNQAIFLVELVIGLNTAAEEAIQLLRLRCTALSWEMRAIDAEARLGEATRLGPRGKKRTAPWPAWDAAVASLIDSLDVAEQARAQLERRYLDGVATLFPDFAADWRRLREQVEGLADLGNRAHGRPSRPGRRTMPSAQAEASHHVEIARGAALDLLGDKDGAVAIAERHLRAEDK